MNFDAKFLATSAKLPQHHSGFFKDMGVIIEWPKGSVRVGEDKDGKKWHRTMEADYGYIPDTTGAGDREPLDVYIGEDETSDKVYVVEQLKEDGSFDEYKCLLGFPDLDTAYQTYLKHYPDGWDDDRVGDISEVPFDYVFDKIEEHQEAQQEKTASGNLPPDVIQKAEEMLASALRDILRPGDNAIVGDWYLESYTPGCAEHYCSSEENMWAEFWDSHDNCVNNPQITIVGDPSEGAFVEVKKVHKVHKVVEGAGKTAGGLSYTAPGTYPSRAVKEPRPTAYEHYVWISCPFSEDHIMRGQKTDHTRFCDQRYYNPPLTTKEYENATRGYAEVKNDSKVVILTISPVCRADFLYYPPSITEAFQRMYPGYKIFTGNGRIAGATYLNALRLMNS